MNWVEIVDMNFIKWWCGISGRFVCELCNMLVAISLVFMYGCLGRNIWVLIIDTRTGVGGKVK